MPDHKIERSNQRHSFDQTENIEAPEGAGNTPGYISYDTPSVYHSIPSTPCSSYRSAPSTPISLDFATPQEYPFDGSIASSTPADALHGSETITENTVTWNGSPTALAMVNGNDTSPDPRSVHSLHPANIKDRPIIQETSHCRSLKAKRIDLSNSLAISYAQMLNTELWWPALLSPFCYNPNQGRVMLRLGEADIEFWSWFESPKLAVIDVLIRNLDKHSFFHSFDHILSGVWSKVRLASWAHHMTLRFATSLLWSYIPSVVLFGHLDEPSIWNDSKLPRGLGDDRLVALHCEYHFKMYGASYEWDGWHQPANPDAFLCPLSNCVLNNDCNEESASMALSLLGLGRDTRIAFEAALIRGRLKWLSWFSTAEPTVLVKSFRRFGSEHFEFVFNWDCPVHGQSCVYSALHYSIRFSSVSVTGALIDCGAEVCGQRPTESCSALGIAIRLDRVGHVGLLLRKGVDPTLPCCGFLRPIELACLLLRKEIFFLLLLALKPLRTLEDLVGGASGIE